LAIIEKNAIFRLGALPAVAGCLGFVPCDCLPTLTFRSARNVIHGYPKDSRRNKFTILGVNRPSGKARKRWNIWIYRYRKPFDQFDGMIYISSSNPSNLRPILEV
jgi:hypothetical protein